MKRVSKILTSILAVSTLVSCFAVSSFAASKARTYTVVADKTEGLVAGDVVTIEVQADELLHSWNAGYTIYFDPDVFTLDTESGGRGKPKKYVDTAWDAEVKSADGIIGWYWGAARTSNEDLEAGTITVGWSGNTEAGEGVTATDNMTDYAIGKYFLIVKDDAPKGETEITVDGATYGFGENSADPMTYVSAKVKVGEDAPEEPEEPETKTLGYEAELAYDGVSTGFQFVAERTDADVTVASDVVTLPSVENLGNVKLGLNIENIPADKTLDDIKAVLNVFARWVK